MKTRHMLLAVCLAFGVMATGPVQAQSWPSKAVHFVVPFPPGGVTDTFARIVSGKLGDALGQPIVIDNRPGGATIIATREVVKAEPDGYTILVGVTQLAINETLRDDVPYDFRKDLVPIVHLGSAIGLVAVHKDHPAKTLADLIELGKGNQKPSVALPGIGSPYHIALEQMNQIAGTDFVNISYKGSGQSINDVVGGHVPIAFDGIVSLAPHIQSGTLRGLAVLGPERAPQLPEIPSTAELGMPAIQLHTIIGLFAPAGTPSGVVDKLNAEVNKILDQPETMAEAKKFGLRLVGGSSESFAKTADETTEIYAKVIKAADIKPR